MPPTRDPRNAADRGLRPRRRAAVAAVLTALVAGAGLVAAISTDPGDGGDHGVALELPAPTGPHPVGTLEMHLADHARTDRDRSGRAAPRELMISVWYPAVLDLERPATPYLPERIASFYDQTSAELGIEPGEVDFAGARSHARTRAAVAPGVSAAAVVLYSPGGGVSRALGTVLVEELAAHGFVVVTVDSTGQAPVQFPDGLRLPVRPDLARAVPERVADLRFVLDQLEGIAAGTNPDQQQRPLPEGLAELLDPTAVGMFGHSLGGFATAETMTADARVDAGANLDGSMDPRYGRAAVVGVDRPFLLLGAGEDGDSGRPHHHRGTPEWGTFWAASTAWKRDVHLPEGEHMSLTDLQVLLPQLAERTDLDEAAVRRAIGTVDPGASLSAQRGWVTAFFDHHLRGAPAALLDRPPVPGAPVEVVP